MAINYSYNFAQVARDSGFKLRQYKDGPLDWRLIGSLEVERILREQSLEQIDSVLSHLSEVPLGSILDTNILDSGIAKYFVLSQFSIQYLLFCRSFLEDTVRDLRESLLESQAEVGNLRKSLSEANSDVLQLNKKMRQMEAIHEVVYPCHMCTKNFVNNEALNLHISRKHPSCRVNVLRNETSPSSNERDNDRNLINTIKLELEIKQLKERLNAAEKDIRERNGANSCHLSPGVSKEKQAKDVGIQSNLIEVKERDDTTLSGDEEDPVTSVRRRELLMKLQTKIQDFERWQSEQKKSNEQSIVDINEKLAGISTALEAVRRERREELLKELGPRPKDAASQQAPSTSPEQLEKLLKEKLAEVGKTSAEKLEEAVKQIEQNYTDKLNELKEEIKLRFELSVRNKAIETREQATSVSEIKEEFNGGRVTTVKEKTEETRHDETFEIVNLRGEKSNTSRQQHKPMEASKNLKSSISTESNRTYVKTVPSAESQKIAKNLTMLEIVGDSTDISDTLSEEGTESSEQSEQECKGMKSAKGKPTTAADHRKKTLDQVKPMTSKNIEISHRIESESPKLQELNKRSQQSKSIVFTRNDAKKLTNRRLCSLGYDFKSKTLSKASFDKAHKELAEHRNEMKKKHPDFIATRNKMRKFINKLCSAKLPDKAEFILRKTQPKRPTGVKHRLSATALEQSSDSELDAQQQPNFSTPLSDKELKQDTAATSFKEQLELLLSYPKRHTEATDAATEIHKVPVPVPRKRVMFNTLNDANDSDNSFGFRESAVEHKSTSKFKN